MTYRNVRDKLISFGNAVPLVFVLFTYPLFALVLFAAGCTEQDSSRSHQKFETPSPSAASSLRSTCPVEVRPRAGARVRADSLREISGIVASRKSPGLFWLHNDSGDSAKVYAIESDGRVAGSVQLSLEAIDFEDIAVERREGASDRIYVADTGDNLGVRNEGVFIHRFEEPTREALRHAAQNSVRATSVLTMHLHFPGGPQDAEALLVDSASGEIVLITKPHMASPEIYGVPRFTKEATLSHLGTITPQTSGHDFQIVTAADMSVDGRWILLRSYTEILAFPRAPSESISDALLGKGCRIQPAYENQGEAIAFVAQTSALVQRQKEQMPPFPQFVTIGEGGAQPLYFYEATAHRSPALRSPAARK